MNGVFLRDSKPYWSCVRLFITSRTGALNSSSRAPISYRVKPLLLLLLHKIGAHKQTMASAMRSHAALLAFALVLLRLAVAAPRRGA